MSRRRAPIVFLAQPPGLGHEPDPKRVRQAAVRRQRRMLVRTDPGLGRRGVDYMTGTSAY